MDEFGPCRAVSRKPDFLAGWGPSQTFQLLPVTGERGFVPTQVHQRNGPVIFAKPRVIQERNPVTLRRETRICDPAVRLVKKMADRILQPKPSFYRSDDCHAFSVRSPVGIV